MILLDSLFLSMCEYERGVPHRIQHFTKVYAYAAYLGRLEGLDESALFTLETAALVHDIGIRPSLEKYHSSAGNYQQFEGPAPARELLERLGFSEQVIKRVCFLVAHHHTYTGVDGLDWRILLEADFLVNALEDSMQKSAILAGRKKIFRTAAGTKLLNTMFDLDEQ